jgi:hypothetical protein
MNLLLRLLHTIWFGLRRSPLPGLGPCDTPMRDWPNDLDVLMHTNNGRYCSAMDLGRVDLVVRAGLWLQLKRLGWG